MLISCLTFWLQNYVFRYPALGNGHIIKNQEYYMIKIYSQKNEKFSKLKSKKVFKDRCLNKNMCFFQSIVLCVVKTKIISHKIDLGCM